MDVDFEWPCDRRDAHGRHPTGCKVLSNSPGMHDHFGSCETGECPGVPAHPATMAGGSDIKIRKQVDAR